MTHPPIVQDNFDEIKEFERVSVWKDWQNSMRRGYADGIFSQNLHDKVLARLYELIAIGLEVPPKSLTEIHRYEGGATGILRYMRYSPFTEDELANFTNPLYGGGHTDSCAITLLFRQPIAALQIKDPQSGTWKWVKPMNNALTVNAADCLSILTGNYIKSTIHRVSYP